MEEIERLAAVAETESVEAFLADVKDALEGAVGHDGELASVLVLIQKKQGDTDNSVIHALYQNASIERRVWLIEGYKHAIYADNVGEAE